MKEGGRFEPPEHVKGMSSNTPGVFKGDQKPRRYGEDALNKSLLGKRVRVTLINSQTVDGIFSNIGMYDITVTSKVLQTFPGNITRETEKPVIVLKSAIATVEVI